MYKNLPSTIKIKSKNPRNNINKQLNKEEETEKK